MAASQASPVAEAEPEARRGQRQAPAVAVPLVRKYNTFQLNVELQMEKKASTISFTNILKFTLNSPRSNQFLMKINAILEFD